MTWATLALTLTLACLTACASEGTSTATATDQLAATPTGSTPRPGTGTIGDMDREMLDSLIEQASEEAGVGEDEISVVNAEAVTWSDGSIGCPKEGMSYTQALVPGYRVILDVAGEEVHYHAGSDARFFACDDPQEPIDDGTVDR